MGLNAVRTKLKRRDLRAVVVFTLLIATTSCQKGSKVLSMSKTDSGEKKLSATDTSTNSGTVASQAKADYRGTQYLEGASGTSTDGSVLAFPIGSLAINATVSMSSGDTLASTGVASALGISTSFSGAGNSVKVASDPPQNATSNPFVLSIPVPSQTSLTSSLDRLVVLYEYYDAKTKSYVTGLLTPDLFEVVGQKIKIRIKYFGTYQAAYAATKITAAVSKLGSIKDIVAVATPTPTSTSGGTTTQATIVSIKSLVADGLYAAGQTISVAVKFTKNVTVTEAPQLTLQFNAGVKYATYVSGSGTDQLQFDYTVVAADVSSALDYSTTSPLVTTSSTIVDASGVSANLTAPTPGATGSIAVSNTIQVNGTAVTVSDVSTAFAANSYYKAGDLVQISVNFSSSVIVDTTNGTPQLTLETGTTDAIAVYTSGTGSSSLVFEFTVAAGQNSALLNYSATNMLALNGGTIKSSGFDVALTLPVMNSNGLHSKALVVDTTAPTVSGLAMAGGGSITNSTAPSFSFTLNEPARVKFYLDPTCSTLRADSTTDLASGTTQSLALSGLSVDGAKTLYTRATDAAGNQSLCSAAPYAFTLDTTVPSISSISTSKPDGNYKQGEVIDISVAYTEAVIVTSTPTIALNSGGSANYFSGSNSTNLTFRYTVGSAENSTNLDYSANISLAGGTIKDAAGNAAALALPSPGGAGSLSSGASRNIDTTTPTATIARSGSAVSSNTTQSWTVTFSETVTGFACSGLTWTGTKNSCAVSGNGTTYTITATLPSTNDGNLVYPSLNQGAGLDLATNQSVAASGSGESVTFYVIATITMDATTPIGPVGIGLTRRPTLSLALDYQVDSVKIYTDAGCGTLNTTTSALSAGAVPSFTMASNLAATGTQQLYAKTTRHTSIVSGCVNIGSYTTGFNKVVVASRTASTVIDWACAIGNGGLSCWGANSYGQIGNGNTANQTTPYQVFPVNSDVTDVAMSYDWNSANAATTCALFSGYVKCWGANSFGQTGDGTITSPRTTPVFVMDSSSSTLTGVTAIYGSTGTFCALKSNADLYCWGKNTYGKVGVGSGAGYVNKATQVSGAYSAVSVGNFYTCGVTTSGGVNCWGFNEYGKLGANNGGNSNVPIAVTGISSGATKISTDDKSTCAVVSGGVKCWGQSTVGQLGDGGNTTSETPVDALGSGAIDVLAGLFSFATLSAGTAFKGWGANTNHQLFISGTYSATDQFSPADPTLLSSYSLDGFGWSIAGGSKDVVCAMVSGGVYCASNSGAYYGSGTGSNPIARGSGVTGISASGNLSCAILPVSSVAHAEIQCWGSNSNGQLGNGTTGGNSLSPIAASIYAP